MGNEQIIRAVTTWHTDTLRWDDPVDLTDHDGYPVIGEHAPKVDGPSITVLYLD